VEGVYLEDAGQSAAPGGPYRPIKYAGGTDIVWRGEIEPMPLRQVVVHAMAVWLAGMAAEELMFGRVDYFTRSDGWYSFADDLAN
ncbi:unnamed protein product, partial [Closterium sp. Naga37s-1]